MNKIKQIRRKQKRRINEKATKFVIEIILITEQKIVQQNETL